MKTIINARVLMIATNGFEEVELFEPLSELTQAGAKVILASIDKNPIHGVIYDDKTGLSNLSNKYITPDITIDEIKIENFDALVLPGGVINPDKLRMIPEAVNIVR
jgi:protease I